MTIDIDPRWAVGVFLLSLRLGVLFMLAPFLAGLRGLAVVRILLTLALSVTFIADGRVAMPEPVGVYELVPCALVEVFVGGLMAFGAFAAFGAFSVAGKVLDVQTGFGIGSVYDPVTRGGAPLFATMLNMAAVVLFYSLDAHHALMRGIAFSLHQVPPGSGLPALSGEAVIRQFGLMFSLGVALVIPVVLILLLVELGLAVVSRVLPQMNVIMVMVPVKVAAGLAVFALAVGTLQAPMAKVFASIFEYWEQVLV